MPTAPDPRLPWLRLARLNGIGPVLVKRLLDHLHSPDAILNAHPANLSAIEGIGTYRANTILASLKTSEQSAREELDRIDADGITLLTPDDPRWPPGLKNIPDPPIILYVRGEIHPEDAVAIGIVGARQCTLYGREQAHRFGAELAQAGLTIVSGGARGIDTASHNGALRVNGRTFVVQGCGLRHTYPPENKKLYEEIVARNAGRGGAIISEFPLDTPPTKENFPPRNRIIAALSLGILVVEANLRSGSLITARLAADDYGREVFALPGPISSPASAGTHHLIKKGAAHLVDSTEDILQNLGEVGAALLKETQHTKPETQNEDPAESEPAPSSLFESKRENAGGQNSKIPLTSTQQKILAALNGTPQTIDDLLDQTALPPQLLIAELTILQIKSQITRHPNNTFAKKLPT